MRLPRWMMGRPGAWALVAAAPLAALLGATALGQSESPSAGETLTDAKCLECHESEMGAHRAVNAKAIAAGPHKDNGCTGCHTAITAAPHTEPMKASKVDCGMCHPDQQTAYAASVHGRADKTAGDHPTCITCHAGAGGDPHSVTRTKGDRVHATETCSRCHSDAARMARYGVDTDAVPSYRESFHGKALLRFGNKKVAGCVDCHGNHAVQGHADAGSPTHRDVAAATCGKAGCHVGAKVNFAMSGANHLRLKVKKTPGLHYEELFFKWLTIGTVLFLMGGIALDLRLKVFGKTPPRSGRPVAALISASFLALATSLAMAFLGSDRAGLVAAVALGVMALAFVVHSAHSRRRPKPAGERTFLRLTVAQRTQHICLALSFTALVLTGLPLRFAETPWLNQLYALLGGMAVARVIHRVAAVVMMITWVWHTAYLVYRWKKAGFKLSSWTMFPTWKDLSDFVQVTMFYLGLWKEAPKYGRFQFKEKFDYFAVYWGMPIMVFSGLVLWFPIYYGNLLPEAGVSAAYIAHSDEAILAFLAILTWHLYNAHFNPDSFPMAKTFYNGIKTESEMQHEHPLELAHIEARAATAGADDTAKP